MFLPVYAALAVALVFYLALPLAGAFGLRAGWRRFRSRVLELSLVPRLRYRDIAGPGGGEAAPRQFRLYGKLEAVEGERLIWVRGEGVTAAVDLSRSPLYILETGDEALAPWAPERAGSVERHAWSRVRVLSEGTNMFIGGLLSFEGGKPVFSEAPGSALVAVSYDGEAGDLLTRLVAGGRDPNEYWNPVARVSIAVGIGVMSLLLLLLWSSSTFPTVRALSFLIAVSPALALAPPGLGLFLFYRRFWRRGLAERTARDLARLPLRYFPSVGEPTPSAAAPLPDGGVYRRSSGASPLGADRVFIPPRGSGRSVSEGWTLFGAEGSDDPAAESLALAGDPEGLAEECRLRARRATLASGLCLGLGILVNYGLAFILWRVFRLG